MCIKCEMKKGILGIFGMKSVQETVGTAAPEFVKELKQLEEAEAKLEKETEAALEAAAEAVYENFKSKIEGLKGLKNKAWKDALASAGIDVEKQAADYAIDKTTGEVTVTKIVEAEDQPEDAQGVH